MRDQLKYRLLWLIGNWVSLVLYYSGISRLYTFIRRSVLKDFRTIVLTYHRVRDDGKAPDISVTTNRFDEQLEYLNKQFNVISLRDAVNTLASTATPDKDQVAISFDDGYKDNYLNALPVLIRHNCSATIFLVSGRIGQSEEILSIEEINQMQSNGINFGSHTVNHPILSGLSEKEIAYEINRSKRDLETMVDATIDLFAYPKGKRRHYNKVAADYLRRAGYIAAFTTENGAITKNKGMYELNRIGIRECPSYVFKVRLSGIFESRIVFKLRQLLKIT